MNFRWSVGHTTDCWAFFGRFVFGRFLLMVFGSLPSKSLTNWLISSMTQRPERSWEEWYYTLLVDMKRDFQTTFFSKKIQFHLNYHLNCKVACHSLSHWWMHTKADLRKTISPVVCAVNYFPANDPRNVACSRAPSRVGNVRNFKTSASRAHKSKLSENGRAFFKFKKRTSVTMYWWWSLVTLCRGKKLPLFQVATQWISGRVSFCLTTCIRREKSPLCVLWIRGDERMWVSSIDNRNIGEDEIPKFSEEIWLNYVGLTGLWLRCYVTMFGDLFFLIGSCLKNGKTKRLFKTLTKN